MAYFCGLFANTTKKNHAIYTNIRKKQLFHELIDFMRPKISLFVTGLAILGHLLFGIFEIQVIYLAFCAFFTTSAAYGYNLITDKKEDEINHKKRNYFVIHQKTGMKIIILFSIIGLISSLYLSKYALLLCFFSVITAIIYSRFRIKEIFPLKNIYTAITLAISFWTGALNADTNINIIIYSIPIVLLLFVISITSDLRDYSGDKKAGIKTIPVIMGYEYTQKIIYISLYLFFAYTLILNLTKLYSFVFFLIPIIIQLTNNQPKIAHKYMMYSFMISPIGPIIF